MSDPVLWRQLYPFESRFWEHGGLRQHYLDEGRGEPLLCVHGNPTWSFYWRHLVLGFRDTRRLVVPDHVGCGLSDKPQSYPYTLSRHTANLADLVRQLDLSDITLVVHDWGGAIGLGALLEDPQRYRRVIVLNTGAFPPAFCPWRIRFCRWPLLGTYAVRQWNVFARAALRMATAKPQRMTRPVRAGLLAPYGSWHDRVAIHGFVRDIPLWRRHPTWPVLASLEQRLGRLPPLPVQIIWGMQDWCFNADCMHRMWRMFPQARLHRLGDAGHYVMEDAHERIIPLVRRFLNET